MDLTHEGYYMGRDAWLNVVQCERFFLERKRMTIHRNINVNGNMVKLAETANEDGSITWELTPPIDNEPIPKLTCKGASLQETRDLLMAAAMRLIDNDGKDMDVPAYEHKLQSVNCEPPPPIHEIA